MLVDLRETNDSHLENSKHLSILVFENSVPENSQNYRDFDPSGKVLSKFEYY
jgi:hypothetical protein